MAIITDLLLWLADAFLAKVHITAAATANTAEFLAVDISDSLLNTAIVSKLMLPALRGSTHRAVLCMARHEIRHYHMLPLCSISVNVFVSVRTSW